jgi:hypothetical protein
MQHVSVYVDDSDAAILAEVGKKEGLSISAVVRRGIRAMCDAAPAAIKQNAATALAEAQENAGALSVENLENAPWSGQSRE